MKTSEKAESDLAAASRSYEADYYGWIEDQVALLKAGRLSEIDAENIAEEIRSVARRQYDKLENAMRALIYNLLKWDLQPDRRSPSMVLSIDAHRDQVTAILDRNPSLANNVPEALVDAYLYATYDVMRDTDLPESTFAPECPYDWYLIRNRPVEFDAVNSPSSSERP
ncbi:DUF29 domain-containing protein [Rhodopseudomonas palustris]|uniref:DUF29 domain-containing protein n=1 Tax=Rhodopseudomonas palustris TaxID=1076 RepID=UPI002ACEB01C|nr:DUF29 domain-containing protein [Rhodopseudomonas palustris]WQG98510.1 DUF29 domain-containing protein [Rhodopseudomonas palustris]